MSVQAAIGHYIDRRADSDRGQLEDLQQQINGNQRMLGNLVQVLVDKELLQADDLLKLLDYEYSLVDQQIPVDKT